MKTLYKILVLITVVLIRIGAYLQGQQAELVAIFRIEGYENGPYGASSFQFGGYAIAVCGFALFTAILTIPRMRKMGIFLFLLAIGFGLFAVATLLSPRHISLDESMWAWYLYLIGIITWAVIASKSIDKAPLPKKDFGDEILDDFN